MTIDIHAHYVPAELIARIRSSKALGVSVIDAAQTPALAFEYGFTVRPFFPKLVEDVGQRITWLDGERIDYQLVATWPDIYGYGLSDEKCVAWQSPLLNDTLAAWCNNAEAVRLYRVSAFAQCRKRCGRTDPSDWPRRAGDHGPRQCRGANIGELPLDPLWAKAEESGYPVIVHPVLTGPAPRAAKFGLTQSTQYTFDTTLGAGSLLYSGVLDRFPQLTIVLARRRRFSLSRWALRHHACAHGSTGTRRRGGSQAVRLRRAFRL